MADLLKAFEASGPKDLADVEHQLDEARKRVQALEAVHKLLDIKLNGKPPPTPRASGARRTPVEETRKNVARFLIASGPSTKAAIARGLGVSLGGSLAKALDSPWFKDKHGAWMLTEDGQSQATRLAVSGNGSATKGS